LVFIGTIAGTVKPRRLLAAALLFLFISFNAQTSEYNINDPRNPNCPCHKYQKLADEEYAKLIRTGNKENGESVGKANSREDKIKRKRSEYHQKIKRRIKDKPHRQHRWIYEFKSWDIWKRVTDPGKCPIWNG
jgi:hypothetical protein